MILIDNLQMNFGRAPSMKCSALESGDTSSPVTPWMVQHLSGEHTQTFTARLGPTGGDQGYKGITGQIQSIYLT